MQSGRGRVCVVWRGIRSSVVAAGDVAAAVETSSVEFVLVVAVPREGAVRSRCGNKNEDSAAGRLASPQVNACQKGEKRQNVS